MSGFVANGTTESGSVNSSAFWPAIDLDELRATLRIDASVTTPRLKTAVITALIGVHNEFKAWRTEQQAAGYATLADVPSEKIEDESVQVHLYRRAIEAATGAEVCERYRSYDTTNSGNRQADELMPSIDEYRRDLRWAVRDFLGLPRTTVDLV
ncbi:hypothetical protein ALP29_03492 [Pseudomonas syringae pv. avii]|uniref:Head completion/stabilization protein n=1 Tax=Pseudomonas syringae pv. avii TaxID=663959 RepID=A0A3M5W4Q4_PSESX|nr:head completion/stabilization protein [Pseudomonas azotoformans]RMT70236.1 hypothetical protein ALP43_04264 [Pseudomonas azotoformans]RMU65396.1 hypothetical protein ALP29_03492 [Pseudomonas syringae pv. avii]